MQTPHATRAESVMNVYTSLEKGAMFNIKNYQFNITNDNSSMSFQVFRTQHVENATVIIPVKEDSSIIFSGATINEGRRRKTILDDILLIGSLLSGWNWVLHSDREERDFPLITQPNLQSIHLTTREQIEQLFVAPLSRIEDATWQTQYENGYHLRMLLNRANIIHQESRFLANVVLWEWLYIHRNSKPQESKIKLNEIINKTLGNFWNMQFDACNIFSVLRNQLAHSGQLPINRPYAEPWMKNLTLHETGQYLLFFDQLTQQIVLKTLGNNSFDNDPRFQSFLANGTIPLGNN